MIHPWKQWILDNCPPTSEGMFIPPPLKKVLVKTAYVYYDLEPIGDESTIKFYIDDPVVFIAYKTPDLLTSNTEENHTYYIKWELITDITLGWRYLIDEIEHKVITLEQDGLGLEWVVNEDCSNQIDNVNTEIELDYYYYPFTTEVIYNSLVLTRGESFDYKEFGTKEAPSKVIQLMFTPNIGDTLVVSYGKMDYDWIP